MIEYMRAPPKQAQTEKFDQQLKKVGFNTTFERRLIKRVCKEAGLKFVIWHNAESKEQNGEVGYKELCRIKEIEIE